MSSFLFCAFVLTFLGVLMEGFVIKGEKDPDDENIGNGISVMMEGMGNFSSEIGQFYQKVRMGKELEDGDDGEEVGGDGVPPDMILTINQTSSAAGKVAEKMLNGLVKKTGMDKIGIPVVDQNSQFVDKVRKETNNVMMGMAVAMAGMANLMKIQAPTD